jgi:hypothetical protein
MPDAKMLEWSSTPIGDGKNQYTTVTLLPQEEALALQGRVIDTLGKPMGDRDERHKTFPCSTGVVGVRDGKPQFEVKMFASPEQFQQVCPDAVMITAPKMFRG